MPDLRKQDLFLQLGYAGDPAPYESALAARGISRPEKSGISDAKRDAVERTLAELFRRICARGDCAAAARANPDGRTPVLAATQDLCEICAGSTNRAAVDRMIAACRAAGWSKLCIVGGSARTRTELDSLVAGRVSLRLIDGAGARRTLKDSTADLLWADRVVIWGATELDHKVSNLYKGPNVLTVHRRGVAHLANETTRSATLTKPR